VSAPSRVLTWRLPPTLRALTYLAAALWCAAGLIFGIGAGLQLSFVTSWVDQPGSDVGNVLWGVAAIAAAVTTALLFRRISLVLSDDTLLIQNVFRSYRIPLAEVVRVSPSLYGVSVEYLHDGRRRRKVATAGQGIKNAWIFKRNRAQSISDVITAQLPPDPDGSGHHSVL